MGFCRIQRPKIEGVRRILLVAVTSARARLPLQRETVRGNLVRARFDAVSLAAFFGSLGYRVTTQNAQQLLKKLPADGETALGEMPDGG